MALSIRGTTAVAVLVLAPFCLGARALAQTNSQVSHEQLLKDKAAWERAAKEAAIKEQIRKEKERFKQLEAEKAAKALQVNQPKPAPPAVEPAPVAVRTVARKPRKAIVRTTPSPASVAARAPSEAVVVLQKAADAYFHHEYATAEDTLRNFRGPSDGQSALYSDLFQSASLYALYLLDGKRNSDLVTDAAKHAALCGKRSPGFIPDTRAFSPQFIVFYQEHAGAAQIR